MEVQDQQLLPLINHSEHRVRSAALECLAASFCDSTDMLRAVFDAWDSFGPEHALPEFPMLSHLPVDHAFADESLLRASAMCRDRKLIDPVCRCAGKLIEAYSVASPSAFAGLLHRFENLRRESKIFFRVDIDAMKRRLQIQSQSTKDLLKSVEASYALEDLEIDAEKLRYSIDELNERQAASEVWDRTLTLLESDEGHSTAITDACLQVLTRRKVDNIESRLVRLLDHDDAKVADSVVIGMARTRTSATLDEISSAFASLSSTGQLRAALVLQRIRFPGVASRIRLLRECVIRDAPVIEALKIAELLQFDFEAIEDWLEALLTIEDQSLHRIEQRLHLAIPLSNQIDDVDRPRFLKLFRSRLVDA